MKPWDLLRPSVASASAWVMATREPLNDLWALKKSADAWSLLIAKYRRGESGRSSLTTDSICGREYHQEYQQEQQRQLSGYAKTKWGSTLRSWDKR